VSTMRSRAVRGATGTPISSAAVLRGGAALLRMPGIIAGSRVDHKSAGG
jgi:hypothetical protein